MFDELIESFNKLNSDYDKISEILDEILKDFSEKESNNKVPNEIKPESYKESNCK